MLQKIPEKCWDSRKVIPEKYWENRKDQNFFGSLAGVSSFKIYNLTNYLNMMSIFD